EVSGEDRSFSLRIHHDLASFPLSHREAVFVHDLDGEPGHGRAHRSDITPVVVRGDAGGFGHPVTFPDLDAETILEGLPRLRRAAAAPGYTHLMRAIQSADRLLEQDLENASKIVNVRHAILDDLFPKHA